MWKQLELDHIITPGFGCQANLHGLSSDISPAAIYTIIWNITGYAAGSLPVTVVKE
jgi:fatty acid amide hydrolase